jgi:hypothetical protein
MSKENNTHDQCKKQLEEDTRKVYNDSLFLIQYPYTTDIGIQYRQDKEEPETNFAWCQIESLGGYRMAQFMNDEGTQKDGIKDIIVYPCHFCDMPFQVIIHTNIHSHHSQQANDKLQQAGSDQEFELVRYNIDIAGIQ